MNTMTDLWAVKTETPEQYDVNQAARVAVFDKIKPQGRWKNPIDAWISAEDLDECSEAAVWFTGSDLEVVERKDGKVRVVAPGYYATIGA
jgi:hypothetical protein